MKAKTIKILYWVFTGLFVLFMLFSAYSELSQIPQAQELMKHLGYPLYVNYIIGAAKVLGAIALVQWKFRTIKEWAYAGFTIDILGASLSMVLSRDPIGSSLFTLVFLMPMFLSYYFWKMMEKARDYR